MDERTAVPGTLPPHAQLIQMATGSWIAAIVYAAAKLGLADSLADGPKSAAELAGTLRAHAPSLHRLMRTLASLGILTEGDGLFQITGSFAANKFAKLAPYIGQRVDVSGAEVVISNNYDYKNFEAAKITPVKGER